MRSAFKAARSGGVNCSANRAPHAPRAQQNHSRISGARTTRQPWWSGPRCARVTESVMAGTSVYAMCGADELGVAMVVVEAFAAAPRQRATGGGVSPVGNGNPVIGAVER